MGSQSSGHVGQRLGGFRLQQELGRGGIGVVYRALDMRSGEMVAVKVLDGSRLFSGSEWDDFRSQLARQAARATQVRHPNLASVYGLETVGALDLLSMELVKGRDLRAILDSGGRWSWAEAASLLAQIAGALASIHRKGLLHGDVKPANVILTSQGNAKLVDFGVLTLQFGRPGESEDTATIDFGTAAYLAPEQFTAGELGPATDVFALGTLGYELVTGEKAFGVGPLMHVAARVLNEEPPLLGAAGADPMLFGPLAPVLRRMLAKAPQDRFSDTQAAARALATCLDLAEGAGEETEEPSPETSPSSDSARKEDRDQRPGYWRESAQRRLRRRRLGVLARRRVRSLALMASLMLVLAVAGAAVAGLTRPSNSWMEPTTSGSGGGGGGPPGMAVGPEVDPLMFTTRDSPGGGVPARDPPVRLPPSLGPPPRPIGGCLSLGQLRGGMTVTGVLSGGSCIGSRGSEDVWTLQVPMSSLIRIDLTTEDFDAYLILEDAQGRQLAQDDDSGAGLNARLLRYVEPGYYRIRATSYDRSERGAYLLEVRGG